ncbi:MAG: hypothetical protein SWX82_02235 [Cyanobacteriota bacterium]|nr:hypothetical protein [Cyanobacteriota bacterium]
MSIKVWPFLVSRNPYLDYRTVVAPDFICEAKTGNLLARVTTGDLTEPGKGFIRQIFGSKVGDFTVVYRILKATQKDLNYQQGDEILKDQFGREILLIEGVVIQEIKSKENVFISQKNIEGIHQKLTEAYTKFWEHRDPHPAVPSQQLSLSMDGSSRPLELQEIEEFEVDPKPPIPQPSPSAPLFSKSSTRLYSLAFIFTLVVAAFFTWRYINTSKVYDCTTTENKNIIFESKKDINNILKKLQKDYPKTTILLNGYLILESNKKWQNLTKREEPGESANYTVHLDGDILKLQDHPLDLAIAQLGGQKVGDISKLQNYLLNLADAKLSRQKVGDILKLQDALRDLKNNQPPEEQVGNKNYIENLRNAQLRNEVRNQELEDILKLQNYLLDLAIAQSRNQEAFTIKAKIISRKNKKECQRNS